MKSWQWKLIGGAALVYITAATILLALTLTLTYKDEQHIEAVQTTNSKTNSTSSKELKQLKTLVNNETASSAYLKTGVNDLRTILVYIGGSLTAICKAETGCVLPKG